MWLHYSHPTLSNLAEYYLTIGDRQGFINDFKLSILNRYHFGYRARRLMMHKFKLVLYLFD